ncbi:MAG TPA: class I SAM-dependent methyltransferase [Opitutaceae bacterium]|nr:class I SAM-dependent methyltransferase [Opitutaceae bacterium]
MAHSVESHLGLKVEDYDRIIRTFIPGYDEMRRIQLALLERILPSTSRILDLGGGTGALAEAVAERFPHSHVEVWDTDSSMLTVAGHRLARFGDRIHLVKKSFAEPLPPCDAVVACIALHHVKDLAIKAQIYSHIYASLRLGGVFLNADAIVSEAPAPNAEAFAGWRGFMHSQDIADEEVSKHFAAWSKEDYYPPLFTELKLLADAGFKEPDCFWRNGAFGVFGGVR